MSNPSHSRLLHAFAILTGFLAMCLIGVGGLVTSHGVGMAVPDWPNTYGYNMFMFPVSQWVGGVLYEHSHRLIATLVGLLTTALAVWLWVRETRGKTRWAGTAAFVSVVVLLGIRQMPVYVVLAGGALLMILVGLVQAARTGWSLRWLGAVAFSTVVLQGVLGGLRVVWAQDEIGIFHAALAQAFFALLAVIVLMTSRWWIEQERPAEGGTRLPHDRSLNHSSLAVNRLLLATTGLVFLQLLVGATMRHQHAGLAIPDFPLAYGSIWPDMSSEAVARYNQQRIETVAMNPITSAQIGFHMAHRAIAVAIVAMVIWCVVRVRATYVKGHEMRRLAGFWGGLIGIQFGLGAWTIWSNKAADIASLHVVCGALSLVTGTLLCVISARQQAETASSPEVNPSLAGNDAGLAATN